MHTIIKVFHPNHRDAYGKPDTNIEPMIAYQTVPDKDFKIEVQVFTQEGEKVTTVYSQEENSVKTHQNVISR